MIGYETDTLKEPCNVIVSEGKIPIKTRIEINKYLLLAVKGRTMVQSEEPQIPIAKVFFVHYLHTKVSGTFPPSFLDIYPPK